MLGKYIQDSKELEQNMLKIWCCWLYRDLFSRKNHLAFH